MRTSIKLTISLPEDLAEFANKLASDSGRPRSQVIADLLEARRDAVFQAELAESYEAMADESVQFAKEAFPLAAEVWPPYPQGPERKHPVSKPSG